MGSRLVMKFGGTSVANVDLIRNAATHVKRELHSGYQVVVVVSAMSGVTNQLIGYCSEASKNCNMREYDTVLASGEQVVSGLLAIILNSSGYKARSWQGWQIPLHTSDEHGSARITYLNCNTLVSAMELGEIPVIAGFQGVTKHGNISTLGRGGSDTTAVAIASSINAERCDMYTDVEGVFTADPNIVPKARLLSHVSAETMLKIARLGANILQAQAAELAIEHQVTVCMRSSFAGNGLPHNGTIVCHKKTTVNETPIIVCLDNYRGVETLYARMVQNASLSSNNNSMLQSTAILSIVWPTPLWQSEERIKVSVKSLEEHDIKVIGMFNSETSVSLLLCKHQAEKAARILHTVYGLDVDASQVLYTPDQAASYQFHQ